MMKKILNELIFSKGMKKLENAFRVKKLSNDSFKVYYEKLKEVDEKVWMQEIDRIIEAEDFFPSIRCLIKYCGKQKSYNASGHELKILL